jgi:phosphate transport system permease protein
MTEIARAHRIEIVYALLEETIVFFGEVGLHDFLFGTKWTPLFEPASFGVLPLVAGTFATTLIGLVVATIMGQFIDVPEIGPR